MEQGYQCLTATATPVLRHATSLLISHITVGWR